MSGRRGPAARGDVGERDARAIARRVLARVLREDAWATLALAGELEGRGLDDRDRRFVTELVYGTLRHHPRLLHGLAAHADLRRVRAPVLDALLVAAYQIRFTRVPPYAAVHDAVEAVRPQFGPRVAGFVNAVLRKIADQPEPAWPAAPEARLALEHSLPPWVVAELRDQLPAGELAAAAAGLKAQAPLWIRVNPARATTAEVAAALVAEGAASVDGTPLAPGALAVTGLGDPGASPSFRAGLWTVQDLGAQLVGLLARPAAGATILDACAGVGGKTLHLAELSAAAGAPAAIDAVDPQPQKLALLASGARRLGATGITTHTGALADAAPARAYDLVVVDAPCSGAGVLRRHPEAALRVRADDVRALAALQAQLLDAAAARVRPGGALVYAVCTITAAEGPAQIASFLARHPDFALAPAELPEAVVDGGLVRTWPHRHGADGFCAARLARRP